MRREEIVGRRLWRFLFPGAGRTNSLSRFRALPDAAHRGATLNELNRRYTELQNQVEAEKKRKVKLDQALKSAMEQSNGWAADVEGLGLPELELLRATLQDMKQKVEKRVEELRMQVSHSTPLFGMNSAHSNAPQSTSFNNLLFKDERFLTFRSFH
ncbi:hypothetical protein H6P81_013757 [Aristolochia fimbriata]|uniref:Uncharacterized protein n=1 Tax=Aristolochia fimbriata TaxID=158543 RepID=A0AAV7EG27_ARIFI|nr:hypothetical protein H6P81_013757 [Aristolochia fimbriata]